jgi:hypothetical protein
MGQNEDEKKAMSLVEQIRIIINSEGEAVPPKRAREEHGIVPDILFIRDDKWALGAKEEHRNVAYDMWKESWTHFYMIKAQQLKPISEYQR